MDQNKKPSFEKAKNFFLGTNNDRTLEEYQCYLMMTDTQIAELSGKKILNIGGGRAPLAKGLNERNITGFSITNVEPYIGLDRHYNNQNILIESDFLETNFNNQFNHVWALYSLPYYAETPEQVIQTYRKAITALAPGGILRLYPAFDFEYNYQSSFNLTLKFIQHFNRNFPQNRIFRNTGGGVEFSAPGSQSDKDIMNYFLSKNININD
ncbi:MAG: hypothetical protein LBK26_00665 [Rickettsiales bacterium]|jgi:hypothetical protein|nr:hypothetical protein [Rickettsiales bacterium]